MGNDRAQRGLRLLEAAYARHFMGIYRFCYRWLGDREAAEDATSVVFLKLAEKFDDLAARDEARLRSWLYGSARNAVRSELRTKRRDRCISKALYATEAREGPTLGDWAEAADRTAIRQAVARLKPVQRSIVRWRYFEGFRMNEIAGMLAKKPVTVRSILSRTLRELKSELHNALIQRMGTDCA